MPANDTRVRENFNRAASSRDRHFAPADYGHAVPKEIRPNYAGGEKQYQKDVKTYAKTRGWKYGQGHDMAHHGQGKKHGE